MAKRAIEYNNEISYRENLAQGYRPKHLPRSRKGKIHACYVSKGEKAAAQLARREGIKLSSFRSWSADWRITDPSAKLSDTAITDLFAVKTKRKAKA